MGLLRVGMYRTLANRNCKAILETFTAGGTNIDEFAEQVVLPMGTDARGECFALAAFVLRTTVTNIPYETQEAVHRWIG